MPARHVLLAWIGIAATLTLATGAAGADYRRMTARYEVPAVTLVDQTGAAAPLDRVLSAGRPVILEFFFSSCPTICGLMASTLGAAQPALAEIAADYRMVSISIDPEYDTPPRLAAYAVQFDAGPHWTLLTGQEDAVAQVVRAFDARAVADNKMYHQPLIFIRPRAGAPWVRLDGLLTPDELRAEVESALR